MGNFQGDNYFGLIISGQLFCGAIVWTPIFGGNYPGGNYPGGQLSGGRIIRGAVVLFPKL